MEDQGDHEAETHPGSSSSSSPPSSPSSSSSSSSSSPSHPQSFASSRSSQKELSAPSSSGSSSTSSSPFSGPSSPARAAIDQPSSSASEESSRHALAENVTVFSSNAATLPGPSADGGSPDEDRGDHFDTHVVSSEIQAIEELEGNDCTTEVTTPLLEPPSFGTSLVSVSDGSGTTSEVFTHVTSDNQAPNTCHNKISLDKIYAVEVNHQSLMACVGFLSTPDIAQLDWHLGSSESNDVGTGHDTDQVTSEVNGCTGSSRAQNSIFTDETCMQRMQNQEIISPRNTPPSEKSVNANGLHDDENALKDQDGSYVTCSAEGYSKINTPPMCVWKPEAMKYLPEKSSENAVTPIVTTPTSIVGELTNKLPYDIKAMEESSKSVIDTQSDISGLPRAKTMPSGFLEVVNGEVCPNRHSTFKRSSTDKSKAGRDVPSHTPGPKISKRKQKRLMKRMCTLQKDGTVELDLERSTRFPHDIYMPDELEDYYSTGCDDDDSKAIPPLEIAMLIVGTRGDVQPFVAMGKRLQEHGHRVRLATHTNFEDFVLRAGLEFYPLGGDPKVLAGYMVKNKGFLPSGPLEISTQKKQLKSIINSLLPACTRPHGNGQPFRAQAIIANPPAYGHVHVAEFLDVPLHIFFTMPWTPTNEFPHPLSRVGHSAANRLSYQVVDSLIWWGIRGMINDFRKRKLNLRPITYFGGSQQSVSKLPTGYIWSPHLVPKPKDWGPKIDVVGFCFLNLSQDYTAPDDLVKWLAAGPAPIYIGFGSLPVEDPSGMTKIIVAALQGTSQRGIINKGWGGLGTLEDLPESIFVLDNCPHDWLFSQCAAVVHHGGAGTTAAGLRAACPTTVVPFFGDQMFWGNRVYARGVGPPPIPVDQFSFDKLVHAIEFMLNDEVKQRAISLAEAMKKEDGVEGAVKAFHRHLPPNVPRSPSRLPLKEANHISWMSCLPCVGRLGR